MRLSGAHYLQATGFDLRIFTTDCREQQSGDKFLKIILRFAGRVTQCFPPLKQVGTFACILQLSKIRFRGRDT